MKVLAKSLLFCFLALCYAPVCFSQGVDKITELLQQLNKAKSIKEKASIYSDISWEYRFANKNKSLEYATLGLQAYQKIDDKEGIALSYQDYGNTHYANGDYDGALKYYLISLALLDQAGLKALSAKTAAKIATIYRLKDHMPEALRYAQQAIRLSEQLNNTQGMIMGYANLGDIYAAMEDMPNSFEANQKAYDLSVKSGIKTLISISANSLSTKFYKIKDFKRAIEYGKIALANKNPNDDPANFYNTKANLVSYYVEDHQFGIAEMEIKEILSYVKSSDNIAINTKLLCAVGSNFLGMGKFQAAKQTLNQALLLARKSKQKYWEQQSLYHLDSLYGELKQLDSAYYAFKGFTKIKDSLASDENKKNINKLYVQYETEKKQQQIILLNNANKIQLLELHKKNLQLQNESLENDRNALKIGAQELQLRNNTIELDKKQVEARSKAQKIRLLASENEVQRLELFKRNIFLIAAIGTLLMMVLLGYLFYNSYRLKQEARLQSAIILQQDLATKAVLNAEENERRRISGELHDGLGQMFSAVKMNLSAISDSLKFDDQHSKTTFDKTMNLVDESCREVRLISHQMAPNVLLKAGLAAAIRDFISKIDGKRLKINLETFGLKQRLDQNIETVLYRVIQETVNNVIKHAGANLLDIQLSKDEEGVNVMIEDNGKGFDPATLDKAEGMGLKNIRTRVNFLKGTVDFSSTPGKGALIAIFIPF